MLEQLQNYKQRIDKRYGDFQRSKTDNTLFMECQLFKNRMLKLYKGLETHVLSDKTSGVEKARCAEIAASIALDVLKMESEGIRAVRQLGLSSSAVVKNNALNNLRNDDDKDDNNDTTYNNSLHNHNDQQQHQEQEDDDRKF